MRGFTAVPACPFDYCDRKYWDFNAVSIAVFHATWRSYIVCLRYFDFLPPFAVFWQVLSSFADFCHFLDK